MKNLLKITTVFFLFCINIMTAQEMKYYIEENGKLLPTTKVAFEKSIDHSKNLDVYLENDNGQIGVLYIRRREGKLDAEQMKALKKYLREYAGADVAENNLIVINYFTSVPVIKPNEPISRWYILDKSYSNNLKKETPNCYFIYNDAQTEAPNHYNRKHINLYPDTGSKLLKLLFPAEANYGNAAIIRPDGTYITYLGEYGPDEVFGMMKALKTIP